MPIIEGRPIMSTPKCPNRETFETGAVRDKTDYRYDLMSPLVVSLILRNDIEARNLAESLMHRDICHKSVLFHLEVVVHTNPAGLVHLYAQALHEGASKYGERNWEKGIPESNLLNHALAHLFALVSGDQSENHRSHLVWNVMTLIHFRLKEKGDQ